MNLCGFNRPIACGFAQGRKPTADDIKNADPWFFSRVLSSVEGLILDTAAALGCKQVCPALPGLGVAVGATAGRAAAALVGIESIGLGFGVSIPIVAAGELIGFEAGAQLQNRLCLNCR